MIRVHIRPISLRKWFPPRDPVATAVAMLCVLREDFLLELRGIVGDDFGHLDDNGEAFRRIYFWRNSLRTLEEIKTVLNRLNAQRSFRDAMAREQSEIRTAFEELKRALNMASQDFLRELRNMIGGHLDGLAFQETLDQLDPGQEGLLEVARKRGETHYRFAAELLWAAVLREAPPHSKEQAAETLLHKSAELNPAIVAIDHVLTCYIRDRKLVRRRRP